ncbi:MAG: fibronectin type III domain-containing protein [Oscillospiraceae bacterium]|nr:fibronectin type III domain-containing protein [Oscillospiraceae bacterium]
MLNAIFSSKNNKKLSLFLSGLLVVSLVTSTVAVPAYALSDEEQNIASVYEETIQTDALQDAGEAEDTENTDTEEAQEAAELDTKDTGETVTTEEDAVTESAEPTAETTAVDEDADIDNSAASEPSAMATVTAATTATIKNMALTIGADETERNLTWYSDSTADGEVQLAIADDMSGDTFPAEYESFAAVSASSNVSGYYTNKATISGLCADTTYAYRVGNTDGWSSVYTFTTDSFSSASFSFLLAGDPQIGSSGNAGNDTTGWITTLDHCIDWFTDISFLVSAGDQVESASSETQYESYLTPDALHSLTVAPNIGNHDSTSSIYKQHFTVPNEATNTGDTAAGGDYWYSYNDVLFMSINSNNTSTAVHKAFLESAIAEYIADNGAEPAWKVVTFHHSIYSTASHTNDSDILARRNELPVVFGELGIDAVLMGHDHVYTRSLMMDGTTPITEGYVADGDNTYAAYTKAEGAGETVYLTANSASGSKYYTIQNLSFTFKAVDNQESTPNITKIDVTADAMTFTTYRTGASNTVSDVVDTFTLYKESASADTSELDTLIAEADEKNAYEYTTDTWTVFVAALEEAKEILADDTATQSEIDAATEALRTAMEALATGLVFDITTSARTVEGETVSYMLSMYNANRLMNLSITFCANGDMLESAGYELKNGFTSINQGGIVWTDLGDGMWQGQLVLVYLNGTTGITTDESTDILNLLFRGKALGSATLEITNITASVLDENEMPVYVSLGYKNQSATTVIVPYFYLYDLNGDGVVDLLDLAMAQKYYWATEDSENWDAAQIADVDGSGTVDMVDLLAIYANFTA